jgi:hypothetical protein
MKTKSLNFGISRIIGLYLVVVGLVVLFKILFLEQFKISYIIIILLLLPSFELIIRGFMRKRQKILVIPGVTILLTCIFFLIFMIVFNSDMSKLVGLWPILGLFPSIGLITYYIISLRKSVSIIVPALFLLFLSIMMLLFTTGVLTFKFSYFLLLLVPLLIILIGLYLLFKKEIFFIRKNMGNKNSDKEKM